MKEAPTKLSTTSRELIRLKNEGFLFHGSVSPEINKFEPSIPKGTSPDQGNFNYDNAVFASDNPGSTVLFAIIDNSKLPEDVRSGTWVVDWLENGKTIAKIPLKWQKYLESMKGYVYVLPADTFTDKILGQFKSKLPVKPIGKYIVHLSNYFELDGEIEWSDE